MENIKINSFDEYIKITEEYKGNFLFRGQANKQWKITPSLFRFNDLINQETASVKNSEFYDEANILSSMFKMQHYGEKTRLIDLTNSPYSALFFACDGEEHFTEDGAVYILSCDKNVNFQDEDLIRFANYVVDDTATDIPISDDIVKSLIQDRFISYDHRFSYSNKRALLQGGTAILTGFGIMDDKLIRHKDVDFRSNAIVSIIIPAELKTDILLYLKRFGYCSEILYHTFDTGNILTQTSLISTGEEVTKKVGFNKIIAFYRVKDLLYCREDLINLIDSEYNNLILKYGENARIWLFVYYDEQDRRHSNWICRIDWHIDTAYSIKWEKSYLERRLSQINEEHSEQEVIERTRKILEHVSTLQDEMKSAYKNGGLIDFINVAAKRKKELIELNMVVGNIPFANSSTDDYVIKATAYISNVEQLATDLLFYNERKENEAFLNYWIDVLLSKCVKSKIEIQ